MTEKKDSETKNSKIKVPTTKHITHEEMMKQVADSLAKALIAIAEEEEAEKKAEAKISPTSQLDR